MGESHKGHGVQRSSTSLRTTPSQSAEGKRLGYDHCEVSLPSLRAGGDARSQYEAPRFSTHRPFSAGFTSHTRAGPEFNIVGVL